MMLLVINVLVVSVNVETISGLVLGVVETYLSSSSELQPETVKSAAVSSPNNRISPRFVFIGFS